MSEKEILDYLDHRMQDMNGRGAELGLLRNALNNARWKLREQVNDTRDALDFLNAILAGQVTGRSIDETRLIDEIRQAEMSAAHLYQGFVALSKKIGDKKYGKYVDTSAETLKMECEDLCKSINQLTSHVESLYWR
jgi:hypothetical protein